MSAAPDRRLTPATDRIALESMRGVIDRPAYTPGRPMRLAVPLADLLRAPGGARDRQVTFGAVLTLIDEQDGWSFVQAALDGYCGWLKSGDLGPATAPITHRVHAPATHIYSEPNLKRPDLAGLSLGARLSVTGLQDGFAGLADGGWVPVQHISDQPAQDPAEVALTLLGTPYLWGGNSRWGIDCSGLAQAALAACAAPCPGDSDLQFGAFGQVVDEADLPRPGDLYFWKGHVAMATDETTLIHANAHHMAVVEEPVETVMARAAAQPGEFLGRKRPG